jgi:hypothetical protein
LKVYQDKNLVTTYFPHPDFLGESGSSGEGESVRLIPNFGGNKNENAYVNIAFLNYLINPEQVRKFINGKKGLIASNRWHVVSQTTKVPYSWSKGKYCW